MSEKQQKILWIAALCIVVLFFAAIGWFIGVPMIQMLREDPAVFKAWIDGFGIWSRFLFLGIVLLQVIVALIPGEPVELAAGYVFGIWEGSVLSLLGILLGSAVIFLLVRKLGPKFVQVFFPEKELKRLSFLKDPKKSKVLAFILMTIPGTPKDLLSYFAGLMPIKLWQWLVIVTVSRIPSLVSSTVAGHFAKEEDWLLSGIVLAVTLIASGIGILYYRKICREQQKNTTE